jgi:hypothetical protein
MKTCLSCGILPKYTKSNPEPAGIWHTLQCPRCSNTFSTTESHKAVIRLWDKHNYRKTDSEIIAELKTANGALLNESVNNTEIIASLQSEISDLQEYIKMLQDSNICGCGTDSTGSTTEEICNVCGKIIKQVKCNSDKCAVLNCPHKKWHIKNFNCDKRNEMCNTRCVNS